MKRNRTILAVIAFGVFIAADDLTVVSTMLRQIIFDLEIPMPNGLDQASWIVNAYLIAYVAVMPFIGRLSDIWGRRYVFVGALGLFLAGSVWVPLADSFNAFLAARVLTAVGGGAMVPVAMAIIGDIYKQEERGTALGILGAVDTAGWVWGPLYGALLVRFLSWKWQFYLNIPLSIIGIALAWWALGSLPRPKERPRIDWLGAGILTTGLVYLNIALLSGGDVQAAGSFQSLGSSTQRDSLGYYLIGFTAIIFFGFLQNELKKRQDVKALIRKARAQGRKRVGISPPPLIDVALFANLNFSLATAVNFLVGSVLIIAMVNVPLLVNVLEVDLETAALRSGILLSGMTASMAAAAYVGGRLTARWPHRLIIIIGLLFTAVGFTMMGLTWADPPGSIFMAGQLIILGLGFGLVIAPIGTAVINAAPHQQRGIAASLAIVFRLMGMSVGLSALTGWGLKRFNLLRTQVQLPDLPLTDPAYQQALIDGLTNVTARVLAETFLISAGITAVAILITFWLKPDSTKKE
jgi:MFS family permease